MCQPRQWGKSGASVPSTLPLLRLLDAQSSPVFRAGKELNKTNARSTQRLWGVFRDGRLRGLLLWGGAAGFGALDALLFGGATAPDVGLHRGYNPTGPDDLQCLGCQDQFMAGWQLHFSRGPIK